MYDELRRGGMPAMTVDRLAVIGPIDLYIPASVQKVGEKLIAVQPIGCDAVIAVPVVYIKID